MNRRDFLKGGLTSIAAGVLTRGQQPQTLVPIRNKDIAEMTEAELDERMHQFLAMAGDSTIVLNAHFDSAGTLWLTEPGSIVANCLFERGEVGFGQT